MDKTYFDGIDACNHPIMCGESGSTDEQKLSCQGSVFLGRCETKGRESGRGSNGDG